MPDIYLASEKTLENVKSLVQGFWLEIDSEKKVVLLLKFPASIITSVLKGCHINMVLRNPKLAERSSTIYIYDNLENPLWVTWQKFSKEDNKYKGFDKVMVKLVKATEVRLALYNELNLPIYTTMLQKENQIDDFEEWYNKLKETFKNIKLEKVEDGFYYPENQEKGFTVHLKNVDNSSEPKMDIYSPDEMEIWGEKWIAGKDHYNLNDFLTDGKHGYNQELSVRANLARYFNANEELFFSPKKEDTTELVDFLVHYKEAILIFESKFVISEKQTKLNNAISKAVKQLVNAHKIIVNNPEVVENKKLVEFLTNGKFILRICLFNDKLYLTEKNCKNVIESFEKIELPIFISEMSFFQMVVQIKIESEENYKFNVINNLLRLYMEFLESDDKILILREFKLIKEERTNEDKS